MLTTTFHLLRKHNACKDRYTVLREALTRGDDEPITLIEILDSNGLADAIWALRAVPDEQAAERDRLARLYACACARQVWHLLTERSRTAVEVSERYAVGAATQDELNAAAAYAAADAARAAYAAAHAADAARAAYAAAHAAAADAAYAAYAADASYAAAAYASYAAAARDAQAAKFREMFG